MTSCPSHFSLEALPTQRFFSPIASVAVCPRPDLLSDTSEYVLAVAVASNGTIELRDDSLTSCAVLQSRSDAGPVLGLCWSPDGVLLAAASNSTVTIWNTVVCRIVARCSIAASNVEGSHSFNIRAIDFCGSVLSVGVVAQAQNMAKFSSSSIFLWDFRADTDVADLSRYPREVVLTEKVGLASLFQISSGGTTNLFAAGGNSIHHVDMTRQIPTVRDIDPKLRWVIIQAELCPADDHRLLVIAGNECRIINARDSKVSPASVAKNYFNCCAWLDERHFATTTADGDLQIWSQHGDPAAPATCMFSKRVAGEVFVSDGQRLFVYSTRSSAIQPLLIRRSSVDED